MMPSDDTMTPEPRLRSRCGARCVARGAPKKYWKNGSVRNGARSPRLTCRSENTLTTLGVTLAATSAMVRPDGTWTVAEDGAGAGAGAGWGAVAEGVGAARSCGGSPR